VFNTPLITGLNTPLNTPKRQQNTGDHARTQPYFISTQRISRKFPVANHPGHPLSAVQRSSYWRGFAVIRGFLLRGLRRFVWRFVSASFRILQGVLSGSFSVFQDTAQFLFQALSDCFRLFQAISAYFGLSQKKKSPRASASPQRGFSNYRDRVLSFALRISDFLSESTFYRRKYLI
jgi:hypothetical protein